MVPYNNGRLDLREGVFFVKLSVNQLLPKKLQVFQKVFVDFLNKYLKKYKCYVPRKVFVDQIHQAI